MLNFLNHMNELNTDDHKMYLIEAIKKKQNVNKKKRM